MMHDGTVEAAQKRMKTKPRSAKLPFKPTPSTSAQISTNNLQDVHKQAKTKSTFSMIAQDVQKQPTKPSALPIGFQAVQKQPTKPSALSMGSQAVQKAPTKFKYVPPPTKSTIQPLKQLDPTTSAGKNYFDPLAVKRKSNDTADLEVRSKVPKSSDPPKTPPRCFRTFPSAGAKLKHLIFDHTDSEESKKVTCQSCGKVFKESIDKIVHEHDCKKPKFICPLCHDDFDDIEVCRAHIKVCNPTVFKLQN